MATTLTARAAGDRVVDEMGVRAEPEADAVGGSGGAPSAGIMARQAARPVGAARARRRSPRASADQTPSAAMRRGRRDHVAAAGALDPDDDAAGLRREAGDRGAEAELDAGLADDGSREDRLQVGAVDDPVGQAVAAAEAATGSMAAMQPAAHAASGRRSLPARPPRRRWRLQGRERQAPGRHSARAGCRRRSRSAGGRARRRSTGKPRRRSTSAAVRPPMPAPAMTIVCLSPTAKGAGALGREVFAVEMAGRVGLGRRRGRRGSDRGSSNRGRPSRRRRPCR